MQRFRSLALLPLLIAVFALVFAACGPEDDVPPPAPPPAATPEVVRAESTPAPTATAQPTPEATVEPTPAATAQPTASPTATPAPTQEPTPTPEPTPEATPEPTPEATPEATAAATPEATPEPTPTEEATPAAPAFAEAFQDVRGIVDPSNFGWPREVEGLNGVVSIPAKPLSIITASVGHDEMTLAIVPIDRLVAVGSSSKNITYSNVADLLQEKAEITRDPETIIAQEPDIIVTSPFFSADGIAALSKAGIPVIQTELKQGPESRINNILLMGYIYGEEERAVAFAAEVRERYESLIGVTGAVEAQPRVLALTQYGDKIWTAGKDSTEGGVITAAGGLNVAAEAGIEGNQTTSLEGVIAMNPEVIVIAQPVEFGANEFRQSLLDNEALAELPAVKNEAIYVVESKHFTTLSYWNIRGAEDLARILWPDELGDSESPPFSLAE
ncbi:MAG: ABC transporter substrate-binding protein [Chloroflexota bacterium]|nr:ABC transporter substrate-binding protein [Chloroflexota bacterium]MDE2920821.1 ABC transporter substrate-binding protein [Chloroflexota bacterium]